MYNNKGSLMLQLSQISPEIPSLAEFPALNNTDNFPQYDPAQESIYSEFARQCESSEITQITIEKIIKNLHKRIKDNAINIQIPQSAIDMLISTVNSTIEVEIKEQDQIDISLNEDIEPNCQSIEKWQRFKVNNIIKPQEQMPIKSNSISTSMQKHRNKHTHIQNHTQNEEEQKSKHKEDYTKFLIQQQTNEQDDHFENGLRANYERELKIKLQKQEEEKQREQELKEQQKKIKSQETDKINNLFTYDYAGGIILQTKPKQNTKINHQIVMNVDIHENKNKKIEKPENNETLIKQVINPELDNMKSASMPNMLKDTKDIRVFGTQIPLPFESFRLNKGITLKDGLLIRSGPNYNSTLTSLAGSSLNQTLLENTTLRMSKKEYQEIVGIQTDRSEIKQIIKPKQIAQSLENKFDNQLESRLSSQETPSSRSKKFQSSNMIEHEVNINSKLITQGISISNKLNQTNGIIKMELGQFRLYQQLNKGTGSDRELSLQIQTQQLLDKNHLTINQKEKLHDRFLIELGKSKEWGVNKSNTISLPQIRLHKKLFQVQKIHKIRERSQID